MNRIGHLYNKNKFSNCYKYLIDDMKHILISSIPVALLFVLLSQNILTIFYKNSNLTEINLLKIASLNIIFIPLAVYFYRVLRKISMNVSLLIIPTISFVGQTVVMYLLVNQGSTRLLSIAISEVVFWFLLLIMEFVILLKEFKQLLNK